MRSDIAEFYENLPSNLNCYLHEDELSAPGPGRFTSGEMFPGKQQTGGRVFP